jgi:hypothetical protein
MAGNGDEFVKTGPGNRPGRDTFGKFLHPRCRFLVLGRILAMGIDKNVGVDGDHPTRPSYAKSLMRSHGACSRVVWRPSPLKDALRRRKPVCCL